MPEPAPVNNTPASDSTNINNHHVPETDDGLAADALPSHPSAAPSALINGQNSTEEDVANALENGTQGTSRKRKLHETSKTERTTRASSPPWKKVAVDGPTTLFIDGRRKSSRTNQPAPTAYPATAKSKNRGAQLKERRSSDRRSLPNGFNAARTNGHGASSKSVRFGRQSLQTRVASPKNSNATKSTRRSLPPSSKPPSTQPTRRSHRTIVKAEPEPENTALDNSPDTTPARRRGRPPKLPKSDEPEVRPYPRLRLIVNPTLRRSHPSHFATGKTTQSFGEWLAEDNALEEDGSALPADTVARKDAEMRLRIVRAMEEGGPLSEGQCTRLAMTSSKEPQRKYGNWDFVASHAANFAVLMRQEMALHKRNAARLAKDIKHAIQVEDRWAFLREAKSAEEIWVEEFNNQVKRYKQVVRDIELKWQMVLHEVNRIKLAQWEKEQEVLGNKALDEMLDQSTTLLRRQFRETSEFTSEDVTSRAQSTALDIDSGAMDDERESSAEPGAQSHSRDMSQTHDDEPDSDAELTQEQLWAKYGNILQEMPNSDDDDADDDDNDDNDDRSDDDQSVDEERSEVEPDQEEEEYDAEEGDRSEFFQGDAESVGTLVTNGHTHETDLEEAMNDVIEDGEHTPTPTPDPEESTNYDDIKIDEVDQALLDDSDEESTDMSDDVGDSEEDSDEDELEEEDPDADTGGLLGFYLSNNEIEEVKKTAAEENTSPESDHHIKEQSGEEEAPATTGAQDESPEAHVNGLSAAPSEIESVEDGGNRSTPLPHDAPVSTPTTSIVPPTPNMGRTEVSPLLRGTLREYQHDGVDWLAKLYEGGRNGILADEMGLGKTIQTIALLAYLATHHEVWGPHLVVVPTSVILNWEMEFKKWCPGFRILTYYGNIEERKAKRRGWTNDDMWNVCITSYQLILQDAQAFKKRSWHYLILDEAHNIKNFQSQRWQTLLTFKTHARLLLTGTPLQNNLQELWALLYFLMPDQKDAPGFADLQTFENSMKKPSDQILDQGRQQLDPEAQARVNKLHEVLRPFLLRRLKSEVEKQMPAKYEHVVYCRLSKRQRQLYDEFMSRADTKRTLSSGNYMSIINCLMSLRKVCNHPDLFETRQIVTSFAMRRSAVTSYETKELLVRRRLLQQESLDLEFGDLLPAFNERYRKRDAFRIAQLDASRKLDSLAAKERHRLQTLVGSNKDQSALSRISIEAQWNVVRDLENRARHARRAARKTLIYGKDLVELMTLQDRFDPPHPSRKRPNYSHGDWFLDKSVTVASMIPTIMSVAAEKQIFVTKFGTVTPAVVAEDVTGLTLAKSGMETVQLIQERSRPVWDPYHEARIRLSIAFPDKRLLQYDCGKLQALATLLRDLQTGGHRCLIFTQMTKVLDILEQFLNIHGHRYLRLDGATKIEQRQILTDRFNNDPRILAFILSSRSGGLGINLTGADTVIFYDLDWNPAMDAQCQDRCHRIGQTRDVHIYRFVSEYTIEANILRKSNQKRLLDDVIIQRGDFTTDTFLNRTVSYRDALDDILMPANASAAGEAVDRVLGDLAGLNATVLDSVEDKEDAAAAKVAQKEMVVADDIDFSESTAAAAAQASAGNDPTATLDAAGDDAREDPDAELGHVDDYMVKLLLDEMKDVVVRPLKPKNKKKAGGADWKKGK
jgi:helicase SRCAP/SWR1